jgi:hypothetical protein
VAALKQPAEVSALAFVPRSVLMAKRKAEAVEDVPSKKAKGDGEVGASVVRLLLTVLFACCCHVVHLALGSVKQFLASRV